MHLFFPVLDNGMGLSQTQWGISMFDAGLTVLRNHRVSHLSISYPYPDGACNIATAEFLKSPCDAMVIIDTDVIFSPEDLGYLLSHEEEPFVAGLYPKKQPGLNFPASPLPGQEHVFANDGR